jgi:hypothetical protein
VRGEIAGIPALAQRGGVWAGFVQQRAQRETLFSGVAHPLMVGAIATLRDCYPG